MIANCPYGIQPPARQCTPLCARVPALRAIAARPHPCISPSSLHAFIFTNGGLTPGTAVPQPPCPWRWARPGMQSSLTRRQLDATSFTG